MSPTAATSVYAVIGRPVRASQGPTRFNRWFEAAGLDAVYVALCPPPDVHDAVPSARALGLAGANLTIPFKVTAMASVDRRTEHADRVGAVNHLAWDGDALVGHNTDVDGFLSALDEGAPGWVAVQPTVIGGGGAARAVLAGLASRGVLRADLVVRRPETARPLWAWMATQGLDLEVHPWGRVPPHADLVVMAAAAEAGADVDGWTAPPTTSVWCDLNYMRPDPPQAATLKQRGARYVSGHGMWFHQARASFHRWFPGCTLYDPPRNG